MHKLMLVEDNENMRDVLQILLGMEGYQVVSPAGGEDLMSAVRREKPALVLIDVYLRGEIGTEVNGFDLLRQIRRDEELKDTRVLMSSGLDFRHLCQQEGANGFLLKPYMPEELLSLVRSTLV